MKQEQEDSGIKFTPVFGPEYKTGRSTIADPRQQDSLIDKIYLEYSKKTSVKTELELEAINIIKKVYNITKLDCDEELSEVNEIMFNFIMNQNGGVTTDKLFSK